MEATEVSSGRWSESSRYVNKRRSKSSDFWIYFLNGNSTCYYLHKQRRWKFIFFFFLQNFKIFLQNGNFSKIKNFSFYFWLTKIILHFFLLQFEPLEFVKELQMFFQIRFETKCWCSCLSANCRTFGEKSKQISVVKCFDLKPFTWFISSGFWHRVLKITKFSFQSFSCQSYEALLVSLLTRSTRHKVLFDFRLKCRCARTKNRIRQSEKLFENKFN